MSHLYPHQIRMIKELYAVNTGKKSMKTTEHTIKIQVPEGYRPVKSWDVTTVAASNANMLLLQVKLEPTPPPIDTNDIEYKLSVMRQGLLGREIQYYAGNGWHDFDSPHWNWGGFTYRVKPTAHGMTDGRPYYVDDNNRIVPVPTVPSPRS